MGLFSKSKSPKKAAPTEQIERATLTQLNFEGLSLECETIVLGEDAVGETIQRRRWSTSVLYDRPCTSPEEPSILSTLFKWRTASANRSCRRLMLASCSSA